MHLCLGIEPRDNQIFNIGPSLEERKLMKESNSCDESRNNSEMAVSMVSSGVQGLKRSMDDMLDNSIVEQTGVPERQASPGMKLLSVFGEKTKKKFKKDELDAALYFNNNGMDSDGGSMKPSDQESEGEEKAIDSENDDGDLAMGGTNTKVDRVEHQVPSAPASAHPFPCVWLEGNSPMRNDDNRDSSPQPPTLMPITHQEIENSKKTPPPLSDTANATNSHHHLQADEGQNKTSSTANGATTLGPNDSPLSLMSAPNGLNPSVAADLHRRSPSSASDGEISMDRGSPNPLLNGTSPNGSPLPANTTIIDSDGQSVEVCPQCHKVFKRKVYLQRHMEREHWSTAKVFKCQDCNYETKHQSNLSVHRRTHTGERPYHCGACGQRYTQGHLLKSHIRSRHAGNMELYNLDKKSDSTRGRKSLDMKHELLPPLTPLTHHKQDKISTLLAAAAGTTPVPPTGPKSPFGNLMTPNMTQYMNSLNPYFNNMPRQGGNAAAMMAANPMAALGGGLLTSPRFFLGGMPNGLPSTLGLMPNMPPNPLLAAAAGLPSSENTLTTNCINGLYSSLKLPVKIPEPVPLSPSKLSPNKPQSAGLFVPQDFSHSIKKEDLPADLSQSSKNEEYAADLSQSSKKEDFATDLSQPEDLSIKKDSKHSPVKGNSPHSMTPPKIITGQPEDLSKHNLAQFPTPPSEPIVVAPKSPKIGSPSKGHVDVGPHPMLALEERTALFPGAVFPGLELPFVRSKLSCKTAKNCSHEDQLLKLRKNVLRMLSVLTPDIGIENDIDFNTDQVDQLLYEVIYSNLD